MVQTGRALVTLCRGVREQEYRTGTRGEDRGDFPERGIGNSLII